MEWAFTYLVPHIIFDDLFSSEEYLHIFKNTCTVYKNVKGILSYKINANGMKTITISGLLHYSIYTDKLQYYTLSVFFS